MIIVKNVLDKNFVIKRKWVLISNISRNDAIKVLKKHKYTLKKDGIIFSSKFENTVILTDGTCQALGYSTKMAKLSFVTK